MIVLKQPVSIVAAAAVGGKKESKGPYGIGFDECYDDDLLGQKNWELAEVEFQHNAVLKLYEKTAIRPDIMFAGDLQSQCTASSATAFRLQVPFCGIYGACSTIAQSIAVASSFVSADLSKAALCVTSSHFCSAERQFRTPLDYGSKRPSTAQWTVTAAAAIMIATAIKPPFIKRAMFGRVTDLAITDPANMGAAMAPAAVDTLLRYLSQTLSHPDDYKVIYTGDLGLHGSDMFLKLAQKEGLTIKNHIDCGCEIYDISSQDVECGASGCACSASLLGIKIIPDLLKSGGKVLLIATGALLSQLSVGQKETIPGIAHLIELSAEI